MYWLGSKQLTRGGEEEGEEERLKEGNRNRRGEAGNGESEERKGGSRRGERMEEKRQGRGEKGEVATSTPVSL